VALPERAKLDDDQGYAGYPAVANQRQSLLPDARLPSRLKSRWREGTTSRFSSPNKNWLCARAAAALNPLEQVVFITDPSPKRQRKTAVPSEPRPLPDVIGLPS